MNLGSEQLGSRGIVEPVLGDVGRSGGHVEDHVDEDFALGNPGQPAVIDNLNVYAFLLEV
jgi:hypothetical protein